jgi:hypothetical protein
MSHAPARRPARRRAIVVPLLLSLAAIGVAGCAGSGDELPPGLEYAESATLEFPSAGATLRDTLGSLVPPRRTNALVQARDARVFRIDVDPWQSLDTGEVEEGRATIDPAGRYAVVASLHCQATANLNRYMAEKVGWYLLPGGKLAAWDHWTFGDACTMFDEFRPARGARIADEKALVAWIAKSFPSSIVHASELYVKGLAYAKAGRLDDAQAMLAAGDASFDVTADHKVDVNEGRDHYFTGDRGALRWGRDQLVQAIAEAKAAPSPVAAPAAAP